MDAWDYLVAVVREALQGLGRGMAGAVHAYRESVQMRPAVADGYPYHWTRADAGRVDETLWQEGEQMADHPVGDRSMSDDEVHGRWTDPTYAYEPDNIYHGSLVDPTSDHRL